MLVGARPEVIAQGRRASVGQVGNVQGDLGAIPEGAVVSEEPVHAGGDLVELVHAADLEVAIKLGNRVTGDDLPGGCEEVTGLNLCAVVLSVGRAGLVAEI